MRNEEVLIRANEQKNMLHEIRKRKANWVGHILRRNCLLKQIIEGKIKGQIEVTRRRGRLVRIYWMTLRTGKDTLLKEGALAGGIVLEEGLDLSFHRLLMMMMMRDFIFLNIVLYNSSWVHTSRK